jgi:hypothetical protein
MEERAMTLETETALYLLALCAGTPAAVFVGFVLEAWLERRARARFDRERL